MAIRSAIENVGILIILLFCKCKKMILFSDRGQAARVHGKFLPVKILIIEND
jgi:hypothetical protein